MTKVFFKISLIVSVTILFLPIMSYAGTSSIMVFPQVSYGKKCLSQLHYPKSKSALTFNCTAAEDGLCVMLETTKIAKKSPAVKCETQLPASEVIKQDLTIYKLTHKGFVRQ